MLANIITKSLVVLGGGVLVMVILQQSPSLVEGGPRPSPAAGSGASAAPEPVRASGGGREIALRAGPDGHFRVEAAVEGTELRFLVDTGASLVVLAPQDARRIGIDPERLDYTGRAASANGTVALAPITLREVRIGQLSLRDVAAAVNRAPMTVSLLGNSFLSRLDGYEVVDRRLVLRW